MVEEINIGGWKGKGGLEIENDGDIVVFNEYRKNKESRNVTKNTVKISMKNIIILRDIISFHCVPNKVYGYRWIIKKLQEEYKLNIDFDAWNGGRNRAKYYFPLHYYPLKYLEYYGFINYFGRGSIMRRK